MKRLSSILTVLFLCSVARAEVVRTWLGDTLLVDDCHLVEVPVAAVSHVVEVRASLRGNRDGFEMSKAAWGVELVTEQSNILPVTMKWGNTYYGDPADQRFLEVLLPGHENPVRFTRHVNLYEGENSLLIEITPQGEAKVFVGDDKAHYVGTVNLPGRLRGVKLCSYGTLDVTAVAVESTLMPNLNSNLTDQEIARAMTVTAEPLGLWHFLDRENDIRYARPGGDYDLLVVKDSASDDGSLLVVYMGGARVNGSAWKRGMVKGRLTPTPFQGRYRLRWNDAMMNPVEGECHAVVENGLLTLVFPLQKAQLRYCR